MKSSDVRDFPLFSRPASYVAYVTVSAGYLLNSDGWLPRVISGATLALSTYLLVDYALTKRKKDQASGRVVIPSAESDIIVSDSADGMTTRADIDPTSGS